MRRRQVFAASASFIALALVGCATVGNGPMQRVYVESAAPGTTVRLQGCGVLSTKSAVTPATVWVSRRSTQCRLLFSVPGQEDQSFRLIRHVSRHMSGYGDALDDWCGDDAKNCNSVNDLLGMGIASAVLLVPALAVDFATGSMFELSPSRISHDLH
jgi:hypothetical protein